MLSFSKNSLRNSLDIKFKYIRNLYTKYPTKIIYSHELQSKQVWIYFILTFYPPTSRSLSLYEKAKRNSKDNKNLKGKNLGLGIFSGGIFSLKNFYRGENFLRDFFQGDLSSKFFLEVGNFPDALRPCYHSKIIRHIQKMCKKNKRLYFNDIIWLIITKMKMKKEVDRIDTT